MTNDGAMRATGPMKNNGAGMLNKYLDIDKTPCLVLAERFRTFRTSGEIIAD